MFQHGVFKANSHLIRRLDELNVSFWSYYLSMYVQYGAELVSMHSPRPLSRLRANKIDKCARIHKTFQVHLKAILLSDDVVSQL